VLHTHQTIPTGMVDKPAQLTSHHDLVDRNGRDGWPGV